MTLSVVAAASPVPDRQAPPPQGRPARPLLDIRGLGKRFANGTLALRGVDLQVDSGSFVSLLGPSGCGKSTLLRIVAGLSEPSKGSIDWPTSRYDVHGRPEVDIGFVFQEPSLLPWLTVLKNVTKPLILSGVKRAEAVARAQDVLDMVGLSDFARAYPRELSGGMKMRVSIARALVTRPKILLLDEPFAALDEITRFKLNNDLLALWREHGFTAIFVTHSVFESVYLSERIVVMAPRPGRVHADIRINAPETRTEAFRTSDAYAAQVRSVSAALEEAME